MAAILQAFMNGEWVEIPALQGEDGFSPTVTVADEGDKITITVKDKSGEKSISYEKGAGDMKKTVYDADGDGVVDQAKSAATAESAAQAADAEKLGGELPSAYRLKKDAIDYKTEVKNTPIVLDELQENSVNPVSGKAVAGYVSGKLETLNVIDLDSFTVSFPAAGWTQEPGLEWEVYQQLAPVEGIAYTDYLNYDINLPYNPEPRAALLEAWAGLIGISIVDGSGLLARFAPAPTVDMHITFTRTRKNTQ